MYAVVFPGGCRWGVGKKEAAGANQELRAVSVNINIF